MAYPDIWKAPMDKEMEKMDQFKVWKLVKRPRDARVMKNRWVFANKYGPDGKIISRKARLVAKGYSQIPASTISSHTHLSFAMSLFG